MPTGHQKLAKSNMSTMTSDMISEAAASREEPIGKGHEASQTHCVEFQVL